jgi:hypothetical protein
MSTANEWHSPLGSSHLHVLLFSTRQKLILCGLYWFALRPCLCSALHVSLIVASYGSDSFTSKKETAGSSETFGNNCKFARCHLVRRQKSSGFEILNISSDVRRHGDPSSCFLVPSVVSVSWKFQALSPRTRKHCKIYVCLWHRLWSCAMSAESRFLAELIPSS